MNELSSIINRMIAAGIPPGEAGAMAAEIYAAGVASVSGKSSNAERQQRYRDRKRNERNERNETVTERNDTPVTETVTNRNETVTSNATTVLPIDTKIKISKRQNSERASRGTRIASDWSPSDADRLQAKQEGLSDSEITREALRFVDFWTGKAGAGGVKLDWAATWRNWTRTTAERLGRTPAGSPTQATAPGFYAKFGSEEQDAWDNYGREKRGKPFPRDKAGGWNFPTRWPPGYVPLASSDLPLIPNLQRMQ